MNCVITSKKCLTGTDRVAEVANKIKSDIYINVQGDEPICDVNDIKKLIKSSKKYPNRIINGYTKIKDKRLFFSKNIPKVVFRKDGRLLYQSRSPRSHYYDGRSHRVPFRIEKLPRQPTGDSRPFRIFCHGS